MSCLDNGSIKTGVIATECVSDVDSLARVRFSNNPFAALMDEDDDEEEDDASMVPQAYVTRSGRTSKQPTRLIEEMGMMAEMDAILAEYTLVGAGIGGGCSKYGINIVQKWFVF